MKSVLISIHPEWCEKIINGQKTIEVRKTRPKIETPFKCYIYCTKPKIYNSTTSLFLDELYRLPSGEIKFGSSIELSSFPDQWNKDNFLNGKVIGEFICNQIDSLDPNTSGLFTDFTTPLLRICMSLGEIIEYNNRNDVYLWHISDLVIYDKPKELSEFVIECKRVYCTEKCIHYGSDCYVDHNCHKSVRPVKRPPQSWCYVQERFFI